MQVCGCPVCGLPAEVIDEDDARGSLGGLVRVVCVGRHWFLGPRDRLVIPAEPAAEPPARTAGRPPG